MLQLKSPYRDGTTHIVMTPLEFMQHLAALVPRPRLNLIRFHGALAPNAKIRPMITPGRPVTDNDATHDPDNASDHSTARRMSWARLLKRVFDIDVEHCPHCGGNMKIIAAIEDLAVIVKILKHLGLPTSHLRCAVPAPLAVQPVLPVLAFAPPIPALTLLDPQQGPLISSKRPDSTPTTPFYPIQLLSRQSPLAAPARHQIIHQNYGHAGYSEELNVAYSGQCPVCLTTL